MLRDDELPVGAVIGRWVLEGRLGEGATSTVFAARHVDIARRAAVKVLRACRADDPVARARFAREADAAARVRHPHVAPVFDAGVDGDRAFVVMDLVAGDSLTHRLAVDGPLDPPRAARLGRDLCLALAAVHREGVIHRDVKPANVILTVASDGAERAVLVDFGAAFFADPGAVAEPLTMRGELVGTPAYMAPEQAEGVGVDARSDVYALGVLLYECLTGRRPFEAPTWQATLVAVARGRFVAPRSLRPEVPAALDAIVRRAMHRDPARRPASAMQLHALLDAWIASPTRRATRSLTAGVAATALVVGALAARASSAEAPRPPVLAPAAAPARVVAPPAVVMRASTPPALRAPAATPVAVTRARPSRRRVTPPTVERGTHDALILPHGAGATRR